MLIIKITSVGVSVSSGKVRYLICQKCEGKRMIYKELSGDVVLTGGDKIEQNVVMKFIGPERSITQKHYWKLYELEKHLVPADYASWGLPFIFSDVIILPTEIADIFMKKEYYWKLCDLTSDVPFLHVLRIMYKEREMMKAEVEKMCPHCYRMLIGTIQGNLRGEVLSTSEYPPRLYSCHQIDVKCSTQEAKLFGHKINIISGSGNILVRPPEACVLPKEKLVVRITHPNHDCVEIVIPNTSYLYLYHPWPRFRLGQD